MSEKKTPLEVGFSKCEVCGEVKYLSGTPVCDSCRKKRETIGETGDQFCPMTSKACVKEQCMWWWSNESREEGMCAALAIAERLEDFRSRGLTVDAHNYF